MVDGQLTDEFCEQVRGFFDRALQAHFETLALSRRSVSADISFRTPDHPTILQKKFHEVPEDYFPEGLTLASKLERLVKTCSTIELMSAEQADIANKRLDRIGEEIKSFRARHPDEITMDILFLPESPDDYRNEVSEFPLALTQQFLLALADNRQCLVEKITISWRMPGKTAFPPGAPKL